MNALVLGAGVNGLTTARLLLEAGADVRIWAREPPETTTSSVAAAIWYPFEAYPEDRVAAWSLRSLERFGALAQDPATGVTLRDGVDLFPEPTTPPAWTASLDRYAKLTVDELAPPYEDGIRYRVPVIETPIYLAYLRDKVESLGGALVIRTIESTDELLGEADVVVNCTGLGAGALFGDDEVFPIRGQIVRVEQRDVDTFQVFRRADDDFGYVIPRSRDVVLGGTAERGNDSLAADDEATAAILRKCLEHEPRLADAAVLGTRVGLRPGRSEVRLEAARLADGTLLVHDYGHGGAGITLSIGCAEDVVALALAGSDTNRSA